MPTDERELAWYVAFGTWRFAAILKGVYRRHLTGMYADRPDDAWTQYSYVVPALAEVALQHLGIDRGGSS